MLRPTARTGLAAIGIATMVLASGCAAVFRQPDVRLENISLSGIGLRGASLVARLQIDNPNAYDLESRSLIYKLELQDPDSVGRWEPLVQDTISRKLEVNGNSSGIVEIPIEFTYSALGPAVRALLDRGTFGYRVSGRIDVTRPISRSVPYRKTGRVTLQGAK
ncbi:MAG: hypothetical protein FIB01_05650 [Gemmatimonadetes bacterium]|nr:hypothetical protein [Gemmatimonadota bacterium]